LSKIAPLKIIQPLNHAVLFLKETDVILTNDEWRVALNIDLSTYHNITATVKSDLLLTTKKTFTPVTEFKQIE